MSWALQELESILRARQRDRMGPEERKRKVREACRGSRAVGATLHLLLVPPVLSCRHWGDQKEGESSWVQGEVGGQVQGPQGLGMAKSQPWEGPGGESWAKGGGESAQGGPRELGAAVWGSGEALWVPLGQVGTHHLLTPVAQGMVPYLGLFLADLPKEKLLEHNEDVSKPRGARVGGQDGELQRGESPQ